MEESRRKGTVTPLSSLFSVEEAQKAAKRVEDAIAENKNELERLQGFLSDNKNLVNLVQRLPEQLSHDIMVPFGKAAFFPGRLIHTNEFLVLLGEGYYAERTSKQAIEILQRRGKSLNSQVDSVQAMIKNLEAEASFFNTTASEAEEGFVEIVEQEDDVEEDSNKAKLRSGPLQQDAPKFGENVDYAWILSKMDELEKEELADGSGAHSDQNEETAADFDDVSNQGLFVNNFHNPEDFHRGVSLDQTKTKTIAAEFQRQHNHQEDITDEVNLASLALRSNVREEKKLIQNVESVDLSGKLEKLPVLSEEKTVQAATASKVEDRHQTSQPSFDSRKAFTGSIIEHAENLRTTSREQSSTSSQVSGSQSLKPVSRFKMQRR